MKPGWQTTEFWLTLAAIIISQVQIYISDGITWEEALMMISGILAALGYTTGRSLLKSKK